MAYRSPAGIAPPPYAYEGQPPGYRPPTYSVAAGIHGAGPSAMPAGPTRPDPTKIPECMEEMRLAQNSKERNFYEEQGEVFAVVRTLDKLELVFAKSMTTSPDDRHSYENACSKLLASFKTLAPQAEITLDSLPQFMQRYGGTDCRMAISRLRIGVPSTVEHAFGEANNNTSAMAIMEATATLITALDTLNVGQRSVDGVLPSITAVVSSLNRVRTLPPDFPGTVKMKGWLATLNAMAAVDDLSEEQSRQLVMDLQNAYDALEAHLRS